MPEPRGVIPWGDMDMYQVLRTAARLVEHAIHSHEARGRAVPEGAERALGELEAAAESLRVPIAGD